MTSLGFVVQHVLHISCVILYAYTLYMTGNMPYPKSVVWTYEGRWIFLTEWNLVFQLFYFVWCCVTNVVLTSDSKSSIAQKFLAFRDWFLAAVAFPIGTLVVVMFWSLCAMDKDLVIPKDHVDFPTWLNHAAHSTVLPILLAEMFLVPHKPPVRKVGITATLMVASAYTLWMLYLGFALNIWVYPLFKVLSGVYFGLFIAVNSMLVMLLYIVGEKILKFTRRSQPECNYQFTKVD